MLAVGADAVATHGVVVCGTAGAPVTSDPDEPAIKRPLDREMHSLEQALARAAQIRVHPATPLYVLWHYPPSTPTRGPVRASSARKRRRDGCVYGHLHNESHWSVAVQGTVRGVRYQCVAADAIGFRPLADRCRDISRPERPDSNGRQHSS